MKKKLRIEVGKIYVNSENLHVKIKYVKYNETEKRDIYYGSDNLMYLLDGTCPGLKGKNLVKLVTGWSDFQVDEPKDNVNHPTHYNRKGIEAITAIEASMSDDEFKGYLKGNIMKYMWRYTYKNGIEDLKKAQWYLAKLIEKVDENRTES